MDKCMGCSKLTLFKAYLDGNKRKVRHVCMLCLPDYSTILTYTNCKVSRFPDTVPWIVVMYEGMTKKYA